MCHDYRAALVADMADDAADLGARVTVPALVLWGADGAMARLFDMAAVWAGKCADVETAALPGGHFFIDSAPGETAEGILGFLARRR